MSSRFIAEGGTPITPELATDLRQLVFGTSSIPMRAEWTQTPFTFGAPKEELSYGLRSPRNATRGLLSVVQGFILKYLLFGRRGRNNQDPLICTQETQTNALINALVEILRIISDKGKVTMVLPSPDEEVFVEHSVTFFHDSITEKLFTEEDSPGTLLFLYSAVLTRSMTKIRNDLDSNSKAVPLTMTNNEEGSLMIVTLLLTGRATPYLHNGVVNVGDENTYAIPQYGILSRCTIGLLLWDNDSTQPSVVTSRQPGSRLKTPNFPIWITSCCGHYGVAFNRNPELLRNYHAESRFDLNYYSCSGHNVFMTIDNRVYNEQATGMLERQATTETMSAGGGRRDDESGGGGGGGVDNADLLVREELTMNTPLQRLIHTKWEEAHIRFNVQPSMLSYLFCTTP
ncbi:inactive ubiquitin carboxyl-terminal hydrolase MINDY-4B isoform X2 [Bactrocera tryoni]|uniref:inactive ubiquitin carboxyl-terminal hydrolase MINDY-4B isoform X2 n=1 Tax=Bactrocera tryoni TaxID=59916 RepID=UPI001A9A29BC|nr:inactive ubiquitin carboxyl-terminal hydrolase MINDY-4B isoform X2 [Bactrocera tryoni]